MSTSRGTLTPELKRELVELVDAAEAAERYDDLIAALRARGRWDWAEDLAHGRADANVKLRVLRERLDAAVADSE